MIRIFSSSPPSSTGLGDVVRNALTQESERSRTRQLRKLNEDQETETERRNTPRRLLGCVWVCGWMCVGVCVGVGVCGCVCGCVCV